ncbi:GNAT family N-acetyltransferase [Rhizobium oryzicola]|uniref:GNAT family protein n=1 Tax=Rhizobium oryzicola TaxID=1232668 RepID=A0ABT8SSQ7_9HYPH|nr:GNAT family protein [Rhizobium oryzicola]MDO1581447.1 GNAT family protein [Rhizobium oryzicola]
MIELDVRPVMRSDGAEVIEANRESAALHHPWVSPPTDDAAFDNWFAQTLTGANVSLLARIKATREIVGVFNLSNIVLGNFRSCYLGYYGMAPLAGQGLMTQALGQVLHHAFDEIGLNRVEANIQPGNERSIALVQRCGFQKEGFSPRYLKINGAWRDHERWAKLAE